MPFFSTSQLNRETFLQAAYVMNGNSFAGLAEYERIPLSKFRLMLQVHNEAVERQNHAMKK
jgi:hypothetical protein